MLPSYPFDWCSHMGLDNGELTSLGMTQCYQLGQSLRKRYLDENSAQKISRISQNFNSRDYKFYSTNYERTIVSAWV